jgi:hypothetical protein
VCPRIREATRDGCEVRTSSRIPGPRRPLAEAVCLSTPLEQALEDHGLPSERKNRRPCAVLQRLPS